MGGNIKGGATACRLLVLLAFGLSGCSVLQRPGETVSSSLVDYLYRPGEQPQLDAEIIPTLQVPLRVGLAFVPPSRGFGSLPEAQQQKLLANVRAAFEAKEFISRIEVIPQAYMRPKAGFDGIDQLARLYDLDVMALVSYDQVVNTSERRASLLYWTIVGAYFIEGTENAANTFVDVAVFDVPTRRLLLRAPGVDEFSDRTTLVDAEAGRRDTSLASFERAMAELTRALDVELDNFKAKIAADRSVRVTDASGQEVDVGAGSINWIVIVLLVGGIIAVARRSRGGA